MLSNALSAYHGYFAQKTIAAYERARESCRILGDPPEVFTLLRGICSYHCLAGNNSEGLSAAQECLHLAQKHRDSAPLSLAHRLMGMCLWNSGHFIEARSHLEQAITHCDLNEQLESTIKYGVDLKVQNFYYMALTLCQLGYPDQALPLILGAQQHAHDLRYTINSVQVSFWLCLLLEMRREYTAAYDEAGRLLEMAGESGLKDRAEASALRRQLVQLDIEADGSEALISHFIAVIRESGTQNNLVRFTMLPCILAETLKAAGKTRSAMQMIDETMFLSRKTQQAWNKAELRRIKGEIFLADNNLNAIDQAQDYFNQALTIAREQKAKWWELRAASSLARLWGDQGKHQEAYDLIAPVYDWFTEGFDTADLKEAKALLDELV